MYYHLFCMLKIQCTTLLHICRVMKWRHAPVRVYLRFIFTELSAVLWNILLQFDQQSCSLLHYSFSSAIFSPPKHKLSIKRNEKLCMAMANDEQLRFLHSFLSCHKVSSAQTRFPLSPALTQKLYLKQMCEHFNATRPEVLQALCPVFFFFCSTYVLALRFFSLSLSLKSKTEHVRLKPVTFTFGKYFSPPLVALPFFCSVCNVLQEQVPADSMASSWFCVLVLSLMKACIKRHASINKQQEKENFL